MARHWILVLSLLASRAFASAQPDPLPWRDEVFDPPEIATVTSAQLLALDPELEALLRSPQLQALPSSRQVERLLDLLFGAQAGGFSYSSGASTPAAVTWQRRRGDCLSLTLLAYAAGRALGLNAQMQEVRVPAVHERRGSWQFVNRHVNVVFRTMNPDPLTEVLQPRRVVVDFEPAFDAPMHGRALDEEEIVARFHNNLGVKHLADDEPWRAYAHLRAAVRADPRYGPAYANLAVLYAREGLLADAERWLHHALARSHEPEVALQGLHDLLARQGRTGEAAVYAQRLRDARERDPQHWIAEGERELRAGRPASAIAALERAQALSAGFEEVHRYLALAYFGAGQRERADRQLEVLARLERGEPLAAKLRRKFAVPAAP